MRKLARPSRRTAIATAVTVSTATAAVAFISTANAASSHSSQAKPSAFSCNLSTVRGTYLFRGDGWHLYANDSRDPIAYAGTFHFNGSGKIIRGKITTRVGRLANSMGAFDGTYTLAANCTGTFIIDTPAHVPVIFDFFPSPSGDKFTYIQKDEGGGEVDVDATIAERVSLR